jgi:peptidoglycan/LPS O-acetylase OafA/YrhL
MRGEWGASHRIWGTGKPVAWIGTVVWGFLITAIKYRAEIDGLRALAILPVVLFHAKADGFDGGFVGVDVFFVISGYLITSIILHERIDGRFSIGRFFERRARRIVPPLFVVVAATVPFAWRYLLPGDMQDYCESILAMILFSSNFLFLHETGYFGTATELTPLIHTWSLAVEEQYYLFFPFFLIILFKFMAWRGQFIVLAAMLVSSFGLASWIVESNEAVAFFLLPTRGWEILCGSLCAYICIYYRPLKSNDALALAGLAMIVIAVAAFSQETPMPGPFGLVPCLGTVLIILFGSNGTIVSKVLSHVVLVRIGVISYGTYLWHQPMFAMARHASIDEPSPLMMTCLALLSLVLGYLSWKFIEMPCRIRTVLPLRWFALIFSIFFVFFALFGTLGHFSKGYPDRFSAQNINLIQPPRTQNDCGSAVNLNANFYACDFGDGNSKRIFVLYGDSHAAALQSELHRIFRQNGIRGIRIGEYQDCQILPGLFREAKARSAARLTARCLQNLRAAFASVPEAEAAIVSVRWTALLAPIEGSIRSSVFDNGEGGVELEKESRYMALNKAGVPSFDGTAKRQAIQAALDVVTDSNRRTFLIYPVPEVGWNIPRQNLKRFKSGESIVAGITTSYRRYLERNEFITEVLDEYSGPNVVRIRPSEMLCDSYVKERCITALDRKALYYDDNHLSDFGAAIVVEEIRKGLGVR